ncbi:MAG TPA: hypothetical protein DIT32_01650 [Peptococcaceae bacterium]|nr:hypothetical protein [Peptococcaceae bacterium]
MRYKVWPKSRSCQSWKYVYFREDARAKLIDTIFHGRHVDHLICETDQAIPDDLFDQYDFEYELIG